MWKGLEIFLKEKIFYKFLLFVKFKAWKNILKIKSMYNLSSQNIFVLEKKFKDIKITKFRIWSVVVKHNLW